MVTDSGDRQECYNMHILLKINGEPGGARTRDHRIKSAMLYQLSYRLLGWKTLLYRARRCASKESQRLRM